VNDLKTSSAMSVQLNCRSGRLTSSRLQALEDVEVIEIDEDEN